MSFLDDVKTNDRPQVSLPAGSYGSGKDPGLNIVAYIDKASKLDKSGAMRHSFLVSALKPSREALEAAKLASTNGKAAAAGNPLEEPDYEGTAFLSLSLHELWLCPEATSLAFTEATRNKDGQIQADYVAKAIQDGETNQESIDKAVAHFRQVATDKVIAANTPAEQMVEAVETQYRKELTQISIKVGQFMTLMDWSGNKRDLQTDPKSLVGVKFSGKVEAREFNGKVGVEVTSIYGKSKKA